MASHKRHPHRSLNNAQSSILLQGDCLHLMRTLAPESIDLVCTDPPYGIGFMGKAWDTFNSSHCSTQKCDFTSDPAKNLGSFIEAVGKECLRVMKPGAFLFMTMTPRQDSLARVIVGLEDAGFKVNFTSLYWTFASGFPKAVNIGKAVDKRTGAARTTIGRNPNSREQATKANSLYGPGTVGRTARITTGSSPLEGSYGGFQPKPAVEIVIVAMKPLSERTFADQATKNWKGITWLDGCRIPIVGSNGRASNAPAYNSSGRFPANLLVSDDVLNDGRERKGSATTKVGKVYGLNRGTSYMQEKPHGVNIDDFGSYSRYFSLDAWSNTLPFLIVPKASKREKNEGLENFDSVRRADRAKDNGVGGNNPRNRTNLPKKNHHPTVKPIQLMTYLITLGSRPDDVVLDPFLGSGTTAIAAKLLGRRYVGIEREREYVDIARARMKATVRLDRAPERISKRSLNPATLPAPG